ncbi:putative transcription factor kapC [Aspergillus alliaceus]|uniref:Putative transcription factor kapC n=1 Tax=Petromyces alliaceus TaxID=209559 RepID=A0A5N6FMU9_PETAA|nr:putative transcription factor kapC [Aspergillus alliaceus]KAB8231271.1 putative transcription factor kapC [Aspergillus alliaceus]KAE8391510.1 putative transcription factor kapC [Aspergillus alliaceus]
MQPTLAPAPHPSMQTSAQDHADQVLHDQLLAAHQHLSHPQQTRPQASTAQPPHMQPNATSPRDQNNIDPAISGAAMLSGPPQTPPQPEPTGPESPKTYGKRPLSTSKRAAQNRAAQRAFRQRKESYIRKLEEQVKEFDTMSDAFKGLQAENYQLREYIINLQSRLLESQGEVPELPGNIDLSQPRTDLNIPQPGAGPATASSSAAAPPSGAQQPQGPAQGAAVNDDMNSLNRIAVAGLGMRKHPNEEANYLGNNFPGRRTRNDETQADSDVTKAEQPSHGLPMVS